MSPENTAYWQRIGRDLARKHADWHIDLRRATRQQRYVAHAAARKEQIEIDRFRSRAKLLPSLVLVQFHL